MSLGVVFAPRAAAELRAIARHSQQHWGGTKARQYIQAIEDAAGDLAAGRGTFKDLSALHSGLRASKAGSHYVFCLVRHGEPALVLAILHERMDLIRRLQARILSR